MAASFHVYLYEGATQITDWDATAEVTASLATITHALTAGERAAISDWANLRYTFVANEAQIQITWADVFTPIATTATPTSTDVIAIVLAESSSAESASELAAQTSTDVTVIGTAETWDLIADYATDGAQDTTALGAAESYSYETGVTTKPASGDPLAVTLVESKTIVATVAVADRTTIAITDTSAASTAIPYSSQDILAVPIVESATATLLAERLRSVVEIELNGLDGGWTDITDDVLDGTTVEYGIQGGGPRDRCASTGIFRTALNNSASNSAELLGYYSPGHANCRAGFDVGIRCRWRAAPPYARTFHVGHLSNIDVVPGRFGARRTLIESVDWMDEAAAANVSLLATLGGWSSGAILYYVVSTLSQQPEATDFSIGDSTFTYALDNIQDESTRVLTVCSDLVNSEGSFLYLKGDGTLKFESRSDRALVTTPALTLDDSMQGLEVGRSRDDIVNVAFITIHPRQVDASPTTVLWSRNIDDGDEPIEIASLGFSETIFGFYSDPVTGQRCGGTDMVTPEATVDYVMNTAPDNSGTNITGDLGHVESMGGNSVSFRLLNLNASSTGYVTKLQCRGRGIYDRQQIVVKPTYAASIAQYGERVCRIDMPFQDDENVAAAFGLQLINLYSVPGSVPRRVQFSIDSRDEHVLEVLAIDVGSRIAILETVTGLAAACFVNGYKVTASQGRFYFDWTLAPCDTTLYWQLETAGYSELDNTTVLGYG